MKKTCKSIISLLLVLVLVIQLMPLSGLAVKTDPTAADTPQDYETNANDSSTINESRDVYVLGEIEELREESVKQYRMSDGSFLAVQYSSPVHYQNSSGKWQDFDLSLKKENDMYSSTNGSLKMSFPADLSSSKLFEFKIDEYSLSMSLSESQKTSVVEKTESDNPPPVLEEQEEISENESTPDLSTPTISENTAPESSGTTNEPSESLDTSNITTESEEGSLMSTQSSVSKQEKDSIISTVHGVSTPDVKKEIIKADIINAAAKDTKASAKLTAEQVANQELSYSEVQYQNAFPNTDLVYHNSGYTIKESIVINQPQENYQYSFIVGTKNVTPALGDDGSILFTDKKGDLIYTIPAPFMVDASGAISTDAKYDLSKQDSRWILDVTADASWMNDSSRQFPVTLDPTVTASTNMYYDLLPATYVVQAAPTVSHTNPTVLPVGYGGTNLKEMQSFLALRSLPYLPYSSEVINAVVVMAQSYYSGSSIPTTYIAAHQVTDAPSNSDYLTWIRSLTWNTKPAYSSEILDHAKTVSGTTTVSLDITKAVKNWYNDSTITRAVALTAVDTSQFSGNNVGASYLYGYTTAAPTLYVTYRNNIGLEDYYTYHSYDVGSAGTAYISDHTRELTVITPLVSFASTSNPFALNLVYNSARNNLVTTTTLGMKTKIGSGMSLNIIQKIEAYQNDLKYTDGDGTIHFFSQDSSLGGTDMYYDEDGLGLKIQIQDQWHYLMSDDKGNKWTFMNGFLAIMEDANGNQYEIHYIRGDNEAGNWHPSGTNDLLDCVIQKNKNGSEITVATFTHSSDGYLSTITDYASRVTSLEYHASVFYPNLTNISRDSISLVTFSYAGSMIQINDDVTDMGLVMTTSSGQNTTTVGKVATVCYKGSGSGNQRETTSITFDKNSTTYTTNGISTTYMFDNVGRTVNAYVTQNNYVVGATNAIYSGSGSTSRTNNRTRQTSSLGLTGQSWMRNGNFENTSSYTWTLTKDTSTNIVVKGDKTRTGNYALKGWLQSGASGTTTASHQTYYLQSSLTYVASVYVDTSEITAFGTDGCVKLEVLNSVGTVLASDSVNYITSASVNGGWVRLSTAFQPTGTSTIRISAINAQGIFYADDVQVEPIISESSAAPSNVNLIENGNIQSYGSCWTNTGMTYCYNVGVSTAGSSPYSLRAYGGPTSVRTAYQTVPINLSGAETYVLSGWANAISVHTEESPLYGVSTDPTADGKKRFGLCAEILYADSTKEYHYIPFNPDLQNWQFTSTSIVPSQTSKTVSSIKVSCVYNYNANTAYFDDISLTREVAQTMRYDSNGNLTSVKSTGTGSDTDTYSNGNLIQSVTACNGTYNYSYTNSNNSHLVTNISNGVSNDSFTYDSRGNVTQENLTSDDYSAPIRQKNTYSSDGNRLLSATSFGSFYSADVPYTSTTSYAYSSAYNRMTALPSTVSQFNATTTNTYNQAYDRLSQTSISNAGTISYNYSNGLLDSLVRTNYTGSNSQTYSFTYNSFGDRTSAKVGNITLANYAYDETSGNLTSMTYGNGVVTNYTYDPLYRLKQRTTTTSGSTRTVDYIYNGEGDLYERRDSNGDNVRYQYDSIDRLAGMTKKNTNSTINDTLTTAYQYDSYSRLSRYDYQVGNLFSGYETFNYRSANNSSGVAGSLSSMSLFSNSWINYSYDHMQRLHSRTLGQVLTESLSYAGSTDSGTTLSTTQVNAKSIRDYNDTTVTLHRWEYNYDPAGNLHQEIDTVNNKTTTYTYDSQNQLTKAVTPSITYQYTYDQAGNILTSNIGGTTHTYTYGNSQWKDLLTQYDSHTITYDTIGNPLSYYNGSNYTFTWVDGRSLQSATKGNATTTYAYDADGLRTRKTNSDGTYIDYYWADGMLLAERKCYSSGTQQYVIRFLYDENGSPVGMSYRFGSSNTGSWTNYYYAKNLQGDIVGLYLSYYVSGSTYQQSLAATYEYDPWGNVTVKNSSGAVNTSAYFIGNINPLRFKGYYYDRDTGFYYLQSRYYDPAIGRFINADTLASTGKSFLGCNMFAYCGNNPINCSDPTGHAFMFVTAAIGAVAGAVWGGIKAYRSGKSIWKGALKGAAIGGLVGLGAGAFSGILLAGNVLASTSLVMGGAKALAGVIATGGGSAGLAFISNNLANAFGGVGAQGAAAKMQEVVAKGKTGEALSGLVKNTEHIPSLTGTAAYRIPDGLDHIASILSEVKNYSGTLSFTSQLKDFYLWCELEGYTMHLYTSAPKLSGQLQALVDAGKIQIFPL